MAPKTPAEAPESRAEQAVIDIPDLEDTVPCTCGIYTREGCSETPLPVSAAPYLVLVDKVELSFPQDSSLKPTSKRSQQRQKKVTARAWTVNYPIIQPASRCIGPGLLSGRETTARSLSAPLFKEPNSEEASYGTFLTEAELNRVQVHAVSADSKLIMFTAHPSTRTPAYVHILRAVALLGGSAILVALLVFIVLKLGASLS